MTGYRIGKTVMRNFLAFERAKFDFSRPGLTVVEGEISNAVGCDSNGAGKSALLEAPVWAVTGRTIRERCRGDDVVKLGSKGGAMVDCTINGPKSVRIVRHRAHATHANKVFLYVDGKDVTRGTTQQTDVAIEEELGLDFTTFLNTVAFGARQEVRSFFFASDADRKRVLDKLLGLGAFERAQVLAKARMREKIAALDPLMNRQMAIGYAIEDKRDTLRALEQLPGVDLVELRNQKIAVNANARRVKLLSSSVDRARADLVDAEKAHADKMRVHDRAVDAMHRAVRVLEAEAAKLDEQAAAATRTADSLDARANRVVALSGGDCPVCASPVTEDRAQDVSVALREEAQEQRSAAKKKKRRADEARARISSIERPEPPSGDSVKTHQLDYELRRDELTAAQAALKSSRDKLAVLEDARKQAKASRDELRTDVADLQQELSGNIEQQNSIKAEISRYEFWVQAFGNGGVKSFVIESEIPRINSIATNYAQRLLGQGAFVKLRATKKLKTKEEEREELSIDAGIPGCAQSYAGASKGQRHRLDLSLILAFRAVVAARSACPFDQLFADELFDGVDATGVDCVVEILQEIAATCPVVLVTHDARLKSVGDRRVVVHHDGSGAELR